MKSTFKLGRAELGTLPPSFRLNQSALRVVIALPTSSTWDPNDPSIASTSSSVATLTSSASLAGVCRRTFCGPLSLAGRLHFGVEEWSTDEER